MIRYNTKRYWGYSTDIKPINSKIGDRFLEMDTQLEYVFSDYNKWELIGSNASTFTGGTVSGETNFTNGLTSTTISATTYFGLPTDVFVTGGTYSDGTSTFTNNTGGTFNLTGYTQGSVTSVGLTMPLAFTVSDSPVVSAGTINVTAAGIASQYVRGDGTLATLSTSIGG